MTPLTSANRGTSRLKGAGRLACLATAIAGLLCAAAATNARLAGEHGVRTGAVRARPAQPARDEPITKRRVLSYAHAINLRAADVSGMIVDGAPEHETPGTSREGSEIAQCTGFDGEKRQVADIQSSTYIDGASLERTAVSSDVSVLSGAAFAAREAADLQSPHGRACIKQFFWWRAVESGPPPSAVHVSTSLLPPQAVGTDRVFTLRVTVTFPVAGSGLIVPRYFDFFWFVSGPAEIVLSAYGVSGPVSSSTERRLLSLLLSRAAANRL